MKLIKVHEVLTFTQSQLLKPYIEFNTGKTKKASNSFERNFFKLMNSDVLIYKKR